jgi:hypothetical protein
MLKMSTDASGVEIMITHPLPSILGKAVADLSGVVHSGAELLRHVPALAAAAQIVGGSGPEKQALVLRAANTAVDLYVPAEDRDVAHGLVEGVLPSVIRAILDVSQGRVQIGQAALNTVVEVASRPETQAAALGLLAQCLACLAPRPVAPPSAPSAEAK